MTKKRKNFYKLVCIKCKTEFNELETATNCLKCKSPLEAVYDFEFLKSRINDYVLQHTPPKAVKYLNFYPIADLKKIISLNEGGTPLREGKKTAKELGVKKVFFKDETQNPTGGFKDRGTMVEITKALEMGAKAVVVASTGNMAASVSAYASQAGLPVYVVVPEGTPIGKLSQTLAYGARMIQVRASYSECAVLAEEIAEKFGFYLAGDYVFRGEGQKSQGFEIIEQLFWKSPDYLIAPVGYGTNLAAIYKGMKEFYDLGLVDKMPKIIAAQPKGANALMRSFKKKSREIEALEKTDTIASAVAVSKPMDGMKVLDAIYETKGSVVDVSDEEILLAEKELAEKESIFAEPSAAIPLAALKKMSKSKGFNKNSTVVCVITGNGLKDPLTMLKILPSPPTVEANLAEIDNYLKMKLYNIKGSLTSDKEEAILEKTPTKKEFEKLIEKEFGVKLTAKYLNAIFTEIEEFLKKGEGMTKSDLQHIIEGVLKTVPDKEKFIVIRNFNVNTSKNERAKAKVEIAIKNKSIKIEESDGVGPVDALMRAVRKLIKKEKLMKYWLTNYDVKIDQQGTDATVLVTMELKDKDDNRVITTATSKDVIVASIQSFERAYNILYNKNN